MENGKKCTFKRYELWKKYFRYLVSSFAIFQQNNCIFMEGRGGRPFDIISREESSYLDKKSQILQIFGGIMQKNHAFKKLSSARKIYILHLVVKNYEFYHL